MHVYLENDKQSILVSNKFHYLFRNPFSLIYYIFYQISMEQQDLPQAYVCVIGNDGTGKSTTCNLVNQKTKYSCVERSMKNSEDEVVKKLVNEIRMIDKLTYSYAFEDDWYNFDITREVEKNGKKIKVFWVMLSAPTQVLFKRINSRVEMTIYQHQKCIKYFNKVYEEMAHFYGINLVKSDQPKQKTLADIIRVVENCKNFIGIKHVTLDLLNKHDLELNIVKGLSEDLAECIYDSKILPEIEKFGTSNLYFPALSEICNVGLKKTLSARWIKNNTTRQINQNKLIFKFQCGVQKEVQQIISVDLQQGYLFQKFIEGESKILYKIVTNDSIIEQLFRNKVIILLKGTIYSHTNQRTSQISELGKIRARGSMIFLQMLKRNEIKHSYISLNRDGIILSKFVETNEMEIVFKKQCLGTDKHSFFRLKQNETLCNKDGVYKGGIYVRFDWRNPNHILLSSPNIYINLDPYYYLIQHFAGKEGFFTKFLTSDKCKAIGDKCITEDLISPLLDTHKIKQMVIDAYCTFQYYAHEVGLEVLDGCMMIDNKCQYIWSEINPDCLRVKTIKLREDYDKDIWRAGGSSSKQNIMKKWQTFNQIFIDYFKNHRFMNSDVVQQQLCKQLFAKEVLKQGHIRPGYEQFYRKLYRGHHQRQLIGTIDIINGQPILVQSSQFKETHSNANIREALQYASILPQMLLVDIDGASGKEVNNKNLIESISKSPNLSFFAVGGGIRTIELANQYLNLFQHIVISSNLDIIQQIPTEKRKRIIVQLSINQENQILTHARTINTGVNVIKKMVELCQLGIQKVSITFNNSEGKLQGVPREQLRKLMYDIPGLIKNVIIAGGISSIDDLEFIWGFRKCIPQLGSAIWKRKILIGQIYSKMVRYNENNLIPTVVQNKFGKNLGLVYLNQQALIKSCQQRYLHRFSRQHSRLMKKGEESGNTQRIISMNIDCDNDTLLVTVDEEHPIFCHLETESCFYQQINKSQSMGIQQLQQHILKTKNGGGTGYSYKIQNNSKLAIHKVIEQVDQLCLAQNKERRVEECADVFAHLLMYMNSKDLQVSEVLAVLNKRSKQDRRTKTKKKEQQNVIRVGLAAGKHTKLIFEFLQQYMGIKILPHEKGLQRNYVINYTVINEKKLKTSLKMKDNSKRVEFVSVKPKDLVKLMEKNFFQFGVNYSNVVQNGCEKFNTYGEMKMEGLRLALIKRKGETIDPTKWSSFSKGIIISEYPANTTKYFQQKNIPSNHYSLIKVSGHSEGFLLDKKIDYCDAIVLSGKTIQDNNLEIEAIIKPDIKVILFSLEE